MTKAELLEELEDLKEICDELTKKNKELEIKANENFAWTVEVWKNDTIVGIGTSRKQAYDIAKAVAKKCDNGNYTYEDEDGNWKSADKITIKKRKMNRELPFLYFDKIELIKKDGQWFVKTDIGEFIDTELKGE